MLGQRSSLTANVPAQGFANALTKYYYDALYQLTRADYPNVAPFGGEVDSWSYDDIGNRLTNTVNGLAATYTYLKNGANPLNGQRLSNDGTNAYTWDNNGSNLTRNGPPGNFTFGYSVDNRLSSIAGAASATYTYDYQGRRSSKTVGAVTTTYLYDGLNLVTETTAGNPVNYAFGPGIDEPLATYQSGTLGYFAPDALGTVGVLSSPTGTVQNTYVFDVWGSARSSSATLTNSLGYTGREFAEAALLAYRARYLQPGVGRFNQEDPIGFVDGASLYSYTGGRPVLWTDPSGLGTVINFSSCCVLVSTNDLPVHPGFAQWQQWVHPHSVSSGDVDAIYFADGSALKIPDYSIFYVFTCASQTATPTGVFANTPLGQLPRGINKRYRTKPLPDGGAQQAEFGGLIQPPPPDCKCAGGPGK